MITIDLLSTNGKLSTKESIENPEILVRINELAEKYTRLLMDSPATWTISFPEREASATNSLRDLICAIMPIMLENDGGTRLNVVDNRFSGPALVQSFALTEETVRAAVMVSLLNAYLEEKARLESLENEGRT